MRRETEREVNHTISMKLKCTGLGGMGQGVLFPRHVVGNELDYSGDGLSGGAY